MKFGGIVDSGRGQFLAISKFPENPRWPPAFFPMLIDRGICRCRFLRHRTTEYNQIWSVCASILGIYNQEVCLESDPRWPNGGHLEIYPMLIDRGICQRTFLRYRAMECNQIWPVCTSIPGIDHLHFLFELDPRWPTGGHLKIFPC